MVNFKRLTERAKDVVDKRGGVDSLKKDGGELRGIASGKGSLKDKAKAAGKAIKDPGASGAAGAKGSQAAGHAGEHKAAPGKRPEGRGPATRSK